MAVSRHRVVAGQQPVGKRSEAASLAELVDMILDKGIVIDGWASVSIDAWARVSVLGLELLTIETRMMVTSVETYLRYADAIARITPNPQRTTPSMFEPIHGSAPHSAGQGIANPLGAI
jgi:Gas vesicle protein/Isocitrate/isopropylmalate dehydrogenase